MKEVALVLEGGGMRGIYTTGVLDFFLDHNIKANYCVAVSAGACHGASYLSGQKKRGYRVNVDYLGDKNYLSFRNWVKTGSLFGMEMILDKIPNQLDPYDYNAYRMNSATFKIGVTNCNTGKAEYQVVEDMSTCYDVLQATISLPLVAPIVRMGDTPYLDGGITAPIPIEEALADGKRPIVILTQHRGYEKKKSTSIPIIRKRYRAYPNLIKAMEKRHEVYNQVLAQLERLEAEGKCMVIQPSSKLEVGRFEKDRDKLTAVYKKGYADGQAAYESVLAFLQE